jgi:hypothetical protein
VISHFQLASVDNHLVELGTQDNTSLFYRLLKEEGEVFCNDFSRVQYKPSSHPCVKKPSYITLRLESQRIGVHEVWCLQHAHYKMSHVLMIVTFPKIFSKRTRVIHQNRVVNGKLNLELGFNYSTLTFSN